MKRFFITLAILWVSAYLIIFFLPVPPLLAGISFSRAVYDDQEHLLRLTLSNDDKYRLYTPLTEIAPQLIHATLLQEDQYFYWHYGLNPLAMIKAAWQTYVTRSRRIGASTVTMQVARIRFGIHSKTVWGKIAQIIRALQLEMHYSKNQILESYLNLAPYGNNVEGVGAASLIYFGKSANQLALLDALTLSVIPQNPTHRILSQSTLQERRNKLFVRWIKEHPEDKNQKVNLSLPLQIQKIHDMPFLTPHFVNEVLLTTPPEQQKIITTLDIYLQNILERVTQHYLVRKKSVGVNNAALLLVDARDMGIKALIGSADYFNPLISGQMNGTTLKRSPGSTLKPFIYGLALDQGLIHPDTMLKDVPHSFGNYNPENFDYDFMGPIKAKDALVLSRNIPAIFLADQLNHPNLYEFLEEAQINHLKPQSYYGLSLVLGGAELSMSELTSLYAMLANGGEWHALRLRKDQPLSLGKKLLSPEASFLVLDMLENTPRLESNYLTTKIPVAWKTGTSSGYRDAWSIGVFGPYVLAVWIGNFNNVGNPAFVGKEMASPLLFELIEAINSQVGPLPILKKPTEKLHLLRIPVCKASGMLPTRYCHDTELTWFIPGKSPIKTDTIYREIPIDEKTGLRACHFTQVKFAIYEFWPSDLLAIFKQAGIQRHTPPPYEPSCSVAQMGNTGMAPQITSPQTNVVYVINPNAKKKMLLPFIATVEGDVTSLYWFINETYLGNTRRDQPFLWSVKPGDFVIRVVDNQGRSAARNLRVQI